jgi:hypothetical protein
MELFRAEAADSACFYRPSEAMYGVAMRNTKAQSTTKDAARIYAERHAEAQDLLERIATRLAEHKRRQAATPADWGWAGDLGRITEQLACVLADLGDASAVRAKGLEY